MDESPTKRAILELKKLDGNEECADCGRKGELTCSVSRWEASGAIKLCCVSLEAGEIDLPRNCATIVDMFGANFMLVCSIFFLLHRALV